MKNIILIVLPVLLLFACKKDSIVSSDNISLSVENVQALIDNAEEGDTIILPAGSATWTTRVEIRKKISIMGAGIDKTIITKINGGEAFYVNVDNKAFRISGFTIKGNNESIGISSFNAKNFRIDNNKFLNCSKGIVIWNYSYGVIDHNIFLDVNVEGVIVYGDDNTAWEREDQYINTYGDNLGHPEFVFIEDNDFIFTENIEIGYLAHAATSNHGGRYVFRYNTIEAVYVEDKIHLGSVLDVHGNFYYGRGTVAFEIYNNTIESEHSYRGLNIRGGTGVIFNNIFTGDFSNPVHLSNYRSWRTPENETSGDCPVTINSTTYDPDYCPGDYPCIDQINNLYLWNNTYSGNTVNAEVDNRGYNTVHIMENRDYFNNTEKPGYTPYIYPHPLTQN